MPPSSAYRARFGSLLRAYQLVGYAPDRDYAYVEVNRALRRLHPGVIAEVTAQIQASGGAVRLNTTNDLLVVNDEFTVSVVISRCHCTAGHRQRWRVRFDTRLRPDITVVVRMDSVNQSALDYYLLPRIDIEEGALPLCEDNGARIDAYRIDSLDVFLQLSARTPLQEVA